MIPRFTISERNAIKEPSNGLLIFNNTTNCLNYFITEISKWLSLCGDLGPANLSLLSCDAPTGPQGKYKAGTNITGNTTNTYTVVVKVDEPGSYSILVNTTNGYSFSNSGTFTQTGEFTIVCTGQGTPLKEGQDIPTIMINGAPSIINCKLPPISVDPASAKVKISECESLKATGNYFSEETLSSSTNFIDIPVTVIGEGAFIMETNSVNGFVFSSNSIIVSPATKSIRLYATGVPTNTGNYTFSINGYTCTFDVLVTTTLKNLRIDALAYLKKILVQWMVIIILKV